MSPEQQRFVELRAKGATYNAIASELGVSRRTLFNWKEHLEGELTWDEALELESLREELLGSRQLRARRLAKRLAAIEEELDKRSLADLSTARLLSMADSLHRQFIKETTPHKIQLRTTPSDRTERTIQFSPSAVSSRSPATPSPVDVDDQVQENHGALQCNNGAVLVQSSAVAASAQASTLSQEPVAPTRRPAEQDRTTELSTHLDSALAKETPFAAYQAGTPNDASNGASRPGDVCNPAQTEIESMPSAVPGSNHPQCKTSATMVQSVPGSSGRSTTTSQPPRCLPISPERLVGSNINFREVLEKQKHRQVQPG